MTEKCLHCERDATSSEQTCDKHSPHENAKAYLNGGLLLGGVLLFTVWLPQVGVTILGIAAAIGVLYAICRPLAKRDRRKIEERLERRRLVANADREHDLVTRGDINGVFGEFPPAPIPEKIEDEKEA